MRPISYKKNLTAREISKSNFQKDNTIAAIATPIGRGGIGIVRISGKKAISIGEKIFVRKSGKIDCGCTFGKQDSHRMIYGYIVDKWKKRIIDEIFICPMFGPKSYTREDVIEIHAHSSPGMLKEILDIAIQGGARMAQPGEFTKRAFLNGRIDLTQAEAVMDIINARSQKAREIATKQIKGELKQTLRRIRENIEQAMADIEMGIDFFEIGENEIQFDKNISSIWRKKILEPTIALIKGSEIAIMYKEGINAVIVGKPNVGKSSIFNRLIKKEHAIVTQYPGTTRDIVESQIDLNGITINLIDTAGIHKTKNKIEKLGIGKSREAIDNSDIIIFVTDGSTGKDEEDRKIYDIIADKKVILIENKCDLEVQPKFREKNYKELSGISVSALKGFGIAKIRKEIIKNLKLEENNEEENQLVSSLRQKKCLEEAYESLNRAVVGYENGLPLELVAMDFKEGSQKIDETIGNCYCKDLLDTIFSKFCIGK